MLSWNELHTIATELRERCVGGQVQKIRQPDADTLVLRIRSAGESIRVVVSARLPLARLAEAESDGPTIEAATAICHWVRSVARGRPLIGLTIEPHDRIVVLEFPQGKLYLECIGFGAALLGVDTHGRVVASSRSLKMRQPLELGGPYAAPDQRSDHGQGPVRFTTARAVERYATELIEQQNTASTQGEVSRILQQVHRRLKRLEKNVQSDLTRCEGAESLREDGELLKASLHLIQPGATSVEVTDWYADGMPVRRMSLDPRLTPLAQVERMFRRYRKAINGQAKAQKRRMEVMAMREAFDAIDPVDHSPESCRRVLLKLGLLKPELKGRRKQSAQVRRMPFLLFMSAKGERILVGRGGKDNHATTFKFGKGNDHWLHVRDCPGAHVIVPLPSKGTEPQQETLLDAAALAVHHSKLRGEAGVAVAHTRRKHLKPVKGGAPGLVTMAGSKSIEVFDGERRITRLYAERPKSLEPT